LIDEGSESYMFLEACFV